MNEINKSMETTKCNPGVTLNIIWERIAEIDKLEKEQKQQICNLWSNKGKAFKDMNEYCKEYGLSFQGELEKKGVSKKTAYQYIRLYDYALTLPPKEVLQLGYKQALREISPKKKKTESNPGVTPTTEQGQHTDNKVIDVTPSNQQPKMDDLAGFTSAAEYEPPLPCQSCQEKDKEIEELKHLVNTKIKEKNKVIRAYKALEAKIKQSKQPNNNGNVFDLDEAERHFITEFNQSDDQKKDKLRLMAIEQFGEDRVEELINIIKKPSD